MAGIWNNLKDAFVLSAMHSPLGGEGLARAAYRLQGYSNDQINRAIDASSAEIEARHKNDHGFVNGATSLLGTVLGGADPTYVVGGFGKNFVRRAASQAAVQGAASVVRQGINVGTGQQKHISGQQALTDARNGMLFQAGGEAAGKVVGAAAGAAKRSFSRVIRDADLAPHPDVPVEAPIAPDGMPGNGSVRPIAPHEMARIMGDPDAAGAHGINDNVPQRRMNNRDADFGDIHDEDLAALPPANREFVQQQQAQTPPAEVDPTDYRNDNEPHEFTQAPAKEAPAEPVPEEFAQPIHDSELTPAEAQEIDASAPKPDVFDSMPEQPYVNNIADEGPRPPVNDNGLEPVVPERPLGQRDQAEADQNALHNVDEFGPAAGRQHKNFTEIPTDDPQGNKYLNYKASNGETVPIKMGIEPDGTAEIAIDQFSTKANRLGPKEIRSAMYDLMDMYPEIKRFGGYRRSGAGKGRVQEIEPGARPDATAEQAPATEETPEQKPNIWSDERGAFTPWGKPKKPKLEDIPEDELTPEQRVMKGLRAADPMLTEQDQMRRIERAKRFEAVKKTQYVTGGEEGFHQELSKLSGDLPSLPSPYSIRPHLEQGEVDNLFNQIRDHPALSTTDAIHGREGLQKLLANSGASLPTHSEMEILRKVFPEDPKAPKKSVSSWISDVINAPRSIMASMDLSAPLRQGLPMIHRKEYWTAFGSMFKQIGKGGFDAVQQEIAARPSFHLMKDSGLALTDVDGDLSQHEEKFLSNLATAIPVFGHVVKASERAYVGFLNKLRADTFDSLVNNARAAGKKLNPKDINDIAKYINTATGRGDLNGLVPKFLRGEEFDANKASPLLAGVLFSPRLMASRFQMLNPVYYAKLSPIAQKEAIKSLASTVAFTTTALSVAHMAGVKVGYDPTSTDFGKIRVGHTTYDVTGGFASYVRLIAQEIAAKRTNSDGTKQKVNRLDTIGNFLRNKESPPLSEVHSMLKGVNNDFEKVDSHHLNNVLEDIGKDFVPLVAQDTYGVYKDGGAKQAAISAVPDLFGIGVNTYTPKAKASRKTKFEGFGKGGMGTNFKSGF